MTTATVLDYNAGNVRSVQNALRMAGFSCTVAQRAEDVEMPDLLVVPGVGNFGYCARAFDSAGYRSLIADWISQKRPLLGICVGLQIMYLTSEEDPGAAGLGILPGHVQRFPKTTETGETLTVPHMGWNVVETPNGSADPVAEAVNGQHLYFVHSYYAVPDDRRHVSAVTTYGGRTFPVMAREGSVIGVQFHPEKSGQAGIGFFSALRSEVDSIFCGCHGTDQV